MLWGAKAMHRFSTLFAGLLFGTGLILSGMANPAKVQNFLDLFGAWDPSLAFVMGGAIMVTMPGFWLVQKRSKRRCSMTCFICQRALISMQGSLVGAATFGIGWGLGGFCPGPALTSLPLAASGTLFFVPAMLVGMVIAKYTARAITEKPCGLRGKIMQNYPVDMAMKPDVEGFFDAGN